MVVAFAQVTFMPGTVGCWLMMGQVAATKVFVAAVSKVRLVLGGESSSESNLVFCFNVTWFATLSCSQRLHLFLRCMFFMLPPIGLSAVAVGW